VSIRKDEGLVMAPQLATKYVFAIAGDIGPGVRRQAPEREYR